LAQGDRRQDHRNGIVRIARREPEPNDAAGRRQTRTEGDVAEVLSKVRRMRPSRSALATI
jgi:hypothetical protein